MTKLLRSAPVLLIALAALGGAVNAVAGGGSLISFPALVWVGVPSINANATNTIALWPGSFGSMWGYRRELASTERRMYWLVLPSFVGGILGALLGLSDDAAERQVLPFPSQEVDPYRGLTPHLEVASARARASGRDRGSARRRSTPCRDRGGC